MGLFNRKKKVEEPVELKYFEVEKVVDTSREYFKSVTFETGWLYNEQSVLAIDDLKKELTNLPWSKTISLKVSNSEQEEKTIFCDDIDFSIYILLLFIEEGFNVKASFREEYFRYNTSLYDTDGDLICNIFIGEEVENE